MIKKCNHFIGWLNSYDGHWNLHEDNFKEQCAMYRSDTQINKLLHGQSGHSHKFKYCPKCGEKINWRDLLKIK